MSRSSLDSPAAAASAGPRRVLLVGGGARSGKSRLAESLALQLSDAPVYVATAVAFDAEMTARIARHRADRAGRGFTTVEAPQDVPGALSGLIGAEAVLVDCLTVWLSNRLLAHPDASGETGAYDAAAAAVEAEVDALLSVLDQPGPPVVLVTNEVGLGVVPAHRLGRLFRDVAGRSHQRLAARADAVYLGAMGLMLRLKPGPVEPVSAAAPQPAGGEP